MSTSVLPSDAASSIASKASGAASSAASSAKASATGAAVREVSVGLNGAVAVVLVAGAVFAL